MRTRFALTCVAGLVAAVFILVQASSAQTRTSTSTSSSSHSHSSSDQSASTSGWKVAPGHKVFAVIYRTGPSWKPGVPLMQQDIQPHIDHMMKMMRDGVLMLGGPFTDNSGGEAVIVARDMEEAKAIIMSDRAVQGGLLIPTIKQWDVVLHR